MPDPQPDSLSTKLQVKARVLSDRLFERRGSLLKTAGEPHLSSQLPATERKKQYTDLISSPELLINAIAGASIIGKDGRLRISTAMVDAFAELSDVKR